MKKSIITLTAILLSLSIFAADFEGTLNIKLADKLGDKTTSNDIKLYVKGDRMAFNDKGMQFIVDAKTGDIFIHTPNGGQPMVIKLDLNVVNAMGGAGALANVGNYGIDTDKEPELEVTSETSTIDGYKCVKYTGKTEGTETTVWVAKDFPHDFTKFLSIFNMDKTLEGIDNPFPIKGTTVTSGRVTEYALKFNKETVADEKVNYPANVQMMDLTVMMKQMIETTSEEQLRQMFQQMMPK